MKSGKQSKEVNWQTIERSKPGKAAGPDNISNELMKGAMLFTVKLWTALYNNCMEITNIPTIWRQSTVKVLYIGKGSQNELMKGAMLFTVKLWTALYNKCLEITNIPTV